MTITKMTITTMTITTINKIAVCCCVVVVWLLHAILIACYNQSFLTTLSYGCLLFVVGYSNSCNNTGHCCCFCYKNQQLRMINCWLIIIVMTVTARNNNDNNACYWCWYCHQHHHCYDKARKFTMTI